MIDVRGIGVLERATELYSGLERSPVLDASPVLCGAAIMQLFKATQRHFVTLVSEGGFHEDSGLSEDGRWRVSRRPATELPLSNGARRLPFALTILRNDLYESSQPVAASSPPAEIDYSLVVLGGQRHIPLSHLRYGFGDTQEMIWQEVSGDLFEQMDFRRAVRTYKRIIHRIDHSLSIE